MNDFISNFCDKKSHQLTRSVCESLCGQQLELNDMTDSYINRLSNMYLILVVIFSVC